MDAVLFIRPRPFPRIMSRRTNQSAAGGFLWLCGLLLILQKSICVVSQQLAVTPLCFSVTQSPSKYFTELE